MADRHDIITSPRLGGKLAVVLFVFTLLAFVAESQLTQYVQTTLGYRQPFFIFYIVHSSFWIIFPIHLLYLTATTKHSTAAYIQGISVAITNHLSPPAISGSLEFPLLHFLKLVLALTAGLTLPGLLWFAAISLASVSDVTAIWNTNAFFAYIITVRLFRLKWEPRRLVAVMIATLGVVAVVYGGSTLAESEPPADSVAVTSFKPSAPLVGDLLTLVASIGYGLYQVLYKKYAALPSDPEIASEALYEQICNDGINDTSGAYELPGREDLGEAVYPPPFGLHPNLLTSVVGFLTLIILWIPIPILHYFGIESFRFPENATTTLAISGIAISGVIFNAGFMILLGLWGPIMTSVGNLLTIVLVFFFDILFGAGLEALTAWGVLGSGIIVVAFGVLAYDILNGRP